MANYISKRPIDGKPSIWVIVDGTGNIVNRCPSKEELKGLKKEILPMYTIGNKKRVKICCSCASHDTYINPEGYERWFAHKCQKEKCTGSLCKKCYQREDPFKDGRCKPRLDFTNKELLDSLLQFEKEEKRVPVRRDFENNPRYPHHGTYEKRFGNWSNVLKLAGLDVDSRISKGDLSSNILKGRYGELVIVQILNKKEIDLSGKNHNSYCDGICPTGQIYEVKSSKLYVEYNYWRFVAQNKDKDDEKDAIQWYYFVAFNDNYTKILYIWRVPGEVIDMTTFRVGINNNRRFNVKNMEQYNIIDKFRIVATDTNNDILKKLLCD